jgi:penicillin amidase
MLPFEELPHTVNPPEGYIVSANHKLVPDDAGMEVGADWVAPYRADRIETLITETSSGVTADDCVRWQNDVLDTRALRLLPLLSEALAQATIEPDGPADHCRRLLAEWDGQARPDSVPPLVYLRLMRALVDEWITGPLGADLAAVMPDLTLQIDHLVLGGAGSPEIVARALSAAVDRLVADHGADPAGWRYDLVHRIRDPHPLTGALPGLAPVFGGEDDPVGGSGHTVCLMTPAADGTVLEGASWRFVAELTHDGPRIRDVLRHGSSGLPGSPHSTDQTAAHGRGMTYVVSLGGPPNQATATLVLVPKRLPDR